MLLVDVWSLAESWWHRGWSCKSFLVRWASNHFFLWRLFANPWWQCERDSLYRSCGSHGRGAILWSADSVEWICEPISLMFPLSWRQWGEMSAMYRVLLLRGLLMTLNELLLRRSFRRRSLLFLSLCDWSWYHLMSPKGRSREVLWPEMTWFGKDIWIMCCQRFTLTRNDLHWQGFLNRGLLEAFVDWKRPTLAGMFGS